MNKYKVKSTIYGVFLIVSIIINVILFYYIYELENKNINNYDNENIILTSIYENAYLYINKGKTENDGECTLINVTEYSNYFTEDVIDKIKNNLTMENNNYYDCNNYINTLKNDTIFTKNGMGSIEVNYIKDDIAYVSYSFNGVNKNIIFKKVDDSWYIDMFN